MDEKTRTESGRPWTPRSIVLGSILGLGLLGVLVATLVPLSGLGPTKATGKTVATSPTETPGFVLPSPPTCEGTNVSTTIELSTTKSGPPAFSQSCLAVPANESFSIVFSNQT